MEKDDDVRRHVDWLQPFTRQPGVVRDMDFGEVAVVVIEEYQSDEGIFLHVGAFNAELQWRTLTELSFVRESAFR